MPSKNLLFVMSHMVRQVAPLVKQMIRAGYNVCVAAPKNKNSQYLHDGSFIQLRKIGAHLFGAKKIKNFNGTIVCFDEVAEKFLGNAKIPHISYNDQLGVDLSIWNPNVISGNKQTILLEKYNIAPYQKMILAIEPSEKDIKSLILATQGIDTDDYILALYGDMSKFAARRTSRKISEANKIIYVGGEQDLPSLIRASFAVMCFPSTASFYKIAAAGMGRITAWENSEVVKPNILTKNDLTNTLEKILEIPMNVRKTYESENIERAAKYNLEKNTAKLDSMLKNMIK